MDVAIWRRARPVNGEYDLLFSAPGLVAWSGALPPSGDYLGGGYLQIRDRLYLPIVKADLVRIQVRKVGPVPLAATILPRQTSSASGPIPVNLPATLPSGTGGFNFFGLAPPPPPFWPPPAPVVIQTLNTARDLATYIFQGYNVDPVTGINYQIQICAHWSISPMCGWSQCLVWIEL